MADAILDHFRAVDPVLFALAGRIGPVRLTPTADHFAALAEAIVSQQLSEKAGATIWNRFLGLFPGRLVTPETVLSRPEDVLRPCGISASKARYIRNVAAAFVGHTVTPERFAAMPDGEIIDQLTAIKGVGRWTAEMFLIFSLGREDVFSAGDLGLRNALRAIYGKHGRHLTDRQVAKLTAVWSPYRSYACLVLWKSLAPVP
jgi:DNA-3-methyladenine glycosylase II